MESETVIEVTKAHTDELDHLNHVEAVRYLETAREDWFKDCGLYGEAGFDYTLSPIVVNINYNYRLECFLGERLRDYDPSRVAGPKELRARLTRS